MRKVKVIVTGGRDYSDEAKINKTLTALCPDMIIQGGAPGADLLARVWARDHFVPCVTLEADWTKHGKAAGPIRNREMLKLNPDAVVVAFPGGRGTHDCVMAATVFGHVVLRVQ